MSTTAAQAQDRFSFTKSVQGGITVIAMHGTLNEQFEGKKLAESIKTKKVVLDMREIRRLASWGMSEWMDFLRINGERDLYLVECSTYAVSQLNLVTGLLGNAKLISFYAAYRCENCGTHADARFIVPKDREAIYTLPSSEYECPKCKGMAKLEEYPASFFDTIADRPAFDVDDEVLALFNSKYAYQLAPDVTRFRAFRAVKDKYSYLRLSGSLGMMPAAKVVDAVEGTAVVDLAGIVFDASGVTPWRSFTQTVLPNLKSLQLMNCPTGFVEYAVSPADLRDKVKIRTFALAYECPRCETTIAQMIDVAENLETLVVGTAPPARCTVCQSTLVPVLTPEQAQQLRALPARDRDPVLEKFIEKARNESPDKLENVLMLAPKTAAKPAAPTATGNRTVVAIALGAVALAGVGALAFVLLNKKEHVVVNQVAQPTSDAGSAQPQFTRPDWIFIDVPSSAFCQDQINRLVCVGVSSYRATREEAVVEANDAALEELVNVVALKISDPYFKEQIVPSFSDARSKALTALRDADVDRTSASYQTANDVVRKARKRVVDVLRLSGGPAVPAQRTDWYWEEYAGEKNKANETLVFVRYDVSLDAVRSLVERYGTPSTAKGTTTVTAFPSIAWQDSNFTGGVIPSKPGRLAKSGIDSKAIITAVGDVRITDAAQFSRKLDEAKGDISLTVKAGDAEAQVVQVRL